MAELTISMPAFNTGPYIGAAIESVLRQDVDFDLVVVDDGSTDDTAAVAASFQDQRLRLLRNPVRRGIGYCHNLVLAKSDAPFVAHVDSDDVVLPGAFRKLVDALKADPNAGQAHCYFFFIDRHGRATREAFRSLRQRFLRKRPPGMDYKRALLVSGTVTSGLRTYRREVLDQVGPFDERLSTGEDYEMALRIVDRFGIALVPEFLYLVREHEASTTRRLGYTRWRYLVQRYRICRRLVRDGTIRFPKTPRYRLHRLMLAGLLENAGWSRLRSCLGAGRKRVRRLRRHPGREFRALLYRASGPFYQKMVDHLGWWPLGLVRREPGAAAVPRVAYVAWRYPLLSETFVRREIAALRAAGLHVEVFADTPGDLDDLDEGARALLPDTHYLEPPERALALKRLSSFLLRNPLRCSNLFLYVVFHRYHRHKTLPEDVRVFLKAIYLAGLLQSGAFTHLHAPWADAHAFLALLAARLLRLPYSVHARAYDVQPRASYALREKLGNAAFVVTNSRFNEAHLRALLPRRRWERLHVVYDGVDVTGLKPPRERAPAAPPRMLAVGRLIQEKGFTHLLEACRILKERGLAFRCDIIGGAAASYDMNTFVRLHLQHRRLGLEDCVSFLGPQPFSDVVRAYERAHLVVLPCVVAENGSHDVTPNVLIEAMAMGLPVVSTLLAGIPEIVEDGQEGLLVPPGDDEALAGALGRLLLDEALREQLGRRGLQRVAARFDVARNSLRYVSLFASAGSQAGPSPTEGPPSPALQGAEAPERS